MDRAEALLNYVKGNTQPKKSIILPCNVSVEEGFFVDISSGRVVGRCVELSLNENNHYLPIYYYNRSWRFTALCSQYNIRLVDQGVTLHTFECLERAWEKTKTNYTRVYFLSQRLLCQMITRRLEIQSTQPKTRPISDLKRYRAQLAIFNDLWNLCICKKDVASFDRKPEPFPAVPPNQRIAP